MLFVAPLVIYFHSCYYDNAICSNLLFFIHTPVCVDWLDLTQGLRRWVKLQITIKCTFTMGRVESLNASLYCKILGFLGRRITYMWVYFLRILYIKCNIFYPKFWWCVLLGLALVSKQESKNNLHLDPRSLNDTTKLKHLVNSFCPWHNVLIEDIN